MIRLAAAIAVAAVLAVAGSAPAVSKPGRVERRIATIEAGTDAQALAVARDGRIVLAGDSYQGLGVSTFIRAFRPDATPDASFGTDGRVDFPPDFHSVVAIGIEPDGQIVLVRVGPSPRLYRLNADGSPDSSFGSGGSVDLDFGDGYVFHANLVLYPDGRILVVARGFVAEPEPPPPVHLRRYLPDGSLDPSFGAGGHVQETALEPSDHATAALGPSGTIVLIVPGAVSAQSVLRIARLLPNGEHDPSFSSGLVRIRLARQRWHRRTFAPGSRSWRPIVLRDGRIRVPVTFEAPGTMPRLGVVGLTSRHRPDRRFGNRGLALGPARRSSSDLGEVATVAVRDPRGSILVAGNLSYGDHLAGDAAGLVRRFRRDGTLDRSFGRRGLFRTKSGIGATREQLLVMLDRDTVLLGSQQTTGKYHQWHGGEVTALSAGYAPAPRR